MDVIYLPETHIVQQITNAIKAAEDAGKIIQVITLTTEEFVEFMRCDSVKTSVGKFYPASDIPTAHDGQLENIDGEWVPKYCYYRATLIQRKL